MNPNPNNVTSITAAQPQAVATFTITASIDGFPVQIAVEGKADALRGMIDRLKAIGAQPPVSQPAKQNGAQPVCPTHQVSKASKRPGSLYCPTALPDGGYCKWVGKA